MQVPSITQSLDDFCKDDTEQGIIIGLGKTQTQTQTILWFQFQFHSFKKKMKDKVPSTTGYST